MRLTAESLDAPADRARLHRGWRGALSIAALIGAPIAAASAKTPVTESWSSIMVGSADLRLDGPSWTGPALWACVGLLVAAASILWLSRRPAVVAAGTLAAVLAGGAAVWATVERSHAGRGVSREQFGGVPLGSSRDQVAGSLGQPAGHAHLRKERVALDCTVYVGERIWVHGELPKYAFCFDGDRLARKVRM